MFPNIILDNWHQSIIKLAFCIKLLVVQEKYNAYVITLIDFLSIDDQRGVNIEVHLLVNCCSCLV